MALWCHARKLLVSYMVTVCDWPIGVSNPMVSSRCRCHCSDIYNACLWTSCYQLGLTITLFFAALHIWQYIACLADVLRRSGRWLPIHFLWHTSYYKNCRSSFLLLDTCKMQSHFCNCQKEEQLAGNTYICTFQILLPKASSMWKAHSFCAPTLTYTHIPTHTCIHSEVLKPMLCNPCLSTAHHYSVYALCIMSHLSILYIGTSP